MLRVDIQYNVLRNLDRHLSYARPSKLLNHPVASSGQVLLSLVPYYIAVRKCAVLYHAAVTRSVEWEIHSAGLNAKRD